MKDLKNQMNSIISTLQFPDLAKTFDIGIPNGILFYGPPGCGKTFFAKQFAEEAEKQLKKTVSFHEISIGNIATNTAHGVSINVTKVFDKAKMAAQANNSLAVVIIDELDTVISKPDNINTWRNEERGTFLKMLQEAGKNNVLVIGATNYMDNIDPAVIRPGRFDYKIAISPPDEESRVGLINKLFEGLPKEDKIDLSQWANKFDGKSIADIKAFSEVSRRIAFQETINAQINDPKSPIQALNQEIFTSAYNSLIF